MRVCVSGWSVCTAEPPVSERIRDSAAWVHVFLGLIDQREFPLNFRSDPARLNAVLSLLFLSPSPALSLSLSLSLFLRAEGER